MWKKLFGEVREFIVELLGLLVDPPLPIRTRLPLGTSYLYAS